MFLQAGNNVAHFDLKARILIVPDFVNASWHYLMVLPLSTLTMAPFM
jgi:hypothetical protein